ncbi:YdcF family protein [Croceibacterium sp. TMG7-5b_MA50]|uniref:YdcF family protein n=1 Tax=Croceibacterium sp. TMG7-5b_MA50 TaxID=3121290 RepID=UPI003221A3EB
MGQPAAFLLGLAIAAAMPIGSTAAQDPAGYTAPFADTLATRVFPFLAMLEAAPGWAAAMQADLTLRAIAAARAARMPAADCTSAPRCLTDAWLWTEAEIAIVGERLGALATRPNLAAALVTGQMRPSGRFAAHSALDDAALVQRAWADVAAAMNRVIAVYGQGAEPRYPKIDAMIFDANSADFTAVLRAHGVATAALVHDEAPFFAATLDYATGLLRMNERMEAGSFRPLLSGENASAVAAVHSFDWTGHDHTALLVFGHGPEDAQSRTGVLAYIRMRIAAALFHRGLAPFIIVSGGNVHPNRTPFNEAIEMKRILVAEHGVPADRILIEPHARHTTTNTRNTARLLLAAGFPADRPALIVSDHQTIQYIGSPLLQERSLAEMGVQPGRIGPNPDPDSARFTLTFLPDPVAFHVEAADPLDP